jgi:uncharacterized protein YndB with AHSA1/START domain
VSENACHYVIYIRTSTTVLWDALTETAVTRRWWWGVSLESSWPPGANYALTQGDLRISDDDMVVLEAVVPRRLSFTWHTFSEQWARANHFEESLRCSFARESRSKVTCSLEPVGANVRLDVLHDGFDDDSVVLGAVRQGWPPLLSSLKSLLETGEPLDLSTQG